MVSKTDCQAIWNTALTALESQLSKPSFETWILSLEPVTLQQNTLVLRVANAFNRDWLQNQYATIITESLQATSGRSLAIRFILPSEDLDSLKEDIEEVSLPNEERTNEDSPEYNLNPKYTFSSFVIGESNAASLAVAEAPAKAYNPLFIYGGVGLGKTHLMHAIGHYVLEHYPQLNVVYLSCEKFTNQFISAIQYKRSEEFRNRYRNVDLLMAKN